MGARPAIRGPKLHPPVDGQCGDLRPVTHVSGVYAVLHSGGHPRLSQGERRLMPGRPLAGLSLFGPGLFEIGLGRFHVPAGEANLRLGQVDLTLGVGDGVTGVGDFFLQVLFFLRRFLLALLQRGQALGLTVEFGLRRF